LLDLPVHVFTIEEFFESKRVQEVLADESIGTSPEIDAFTEHWIEVTHLLLSTLLRFCYERDHGCGVI
jgi:hypothetical protein